MSFVKRYFNEKMILDCINNDKSLTKLFNVDALIFTDNKSNIAYSMFKEGKTIKEIKQYLES